MTTCTRPFDEELLSGHLDGSLPQRESQKVRLHLEDCNSCRDLYQELVVLRESTRSSRFHVPDADRWPELPKTPVGRMSRSFGWLLVIVWLVVVSGLALYRFLAQAGDPLEVFIVLGLPGGVVLLFLSVLLDRLKDLPKDRYKDVHR